MKRSKKILLLSANNYTSPYPVYPLGISYIKSHLKKVLPVYDVVLADMNFIPVSQLEELVRSESWDFIGLSLRNIDDNNISTHGSFIKWYRTIAATIRANSSACLLLGGAGYSIFPEMLLDELNADYGFKGEGELPLAEFLKRKEEGSSVNEIEGLVFRDENGSIIVNPRKNFSQSLCLEFEEEWINYYWSKSGMLNIQTKRGCPMNCIYCSYPVIEGSCVRTLDPGEIVRSLKELDEKQKINYIFFTDSVFNIDKDYNIELCNRLLDSNIKINWGAYFTPAGLTTEELKLYKKAGLTHIEFGSDSFSDRQLINYRKCFSWNDIKNVSRYCDDLGIFYAHFLILGGLGETNSTLNETLNNSSMLTNTVVFPYTGMRIYPETELFNIALNEKIINSREDLLSPVFYVSKEADLSDIVPRAHATGCKWFFPGNGAEDVIEKLRARKKCGPLWEYLRF